MQAGRLRKEVSSYHAVIASAGRKKYRAMNETHGFPRRNGQHGDSAADAVPLVSVAGRPDDEQGGHLGGLLAL
jgi:hypothetical protein